MKPQPGGFVYLKVSPIRGTRRFQVRGKLAPRYIGPYRIIERIGAVAYYLELPPEMLDIYMCFTCYNKRNALGYPEEQAPMEAMDLQLDLQY